MSQFAVGHGASKTATNKPGSLRRVDMVEADYLQGKFHSTSVPLILCEALSYKTDKET